jgi:hypothetical protein
MHTFRRIALLTAGLLALAPAAASAETFCVDNPDGCAGTAKNTLQEALDAADANGAAKDTIKIGQGLFSDGPSTDVPGNPVDIEGTAINKTALSTPSNANVPAVLRIQEPTSTIKHLRVHVTSDTIPTGIELAGDADDVLVTNGGGTNTLDGIKPLGTQSSLHDVAVDLIFPQNLQTRAIFAPAGSHMVVSDSYLAAAVGVFSSGSDVDVSRTRMVTTQGMEASGGADSTIADSQITVNSSPTNFPKDGLFAGGTGTSHLTARRVTLVGDGSNSSGVWVSPNPGAGNDASLTLTDSIVHNWSTALKENHSGGATGVIDPSWTAFNFGSKVGNVLAGTGNFDLNGVNPGFANPQAQGLELRWDSPLVDRGDPAFHPFLGFDLLFRARVLDGNSDGTSRVDIGALEYQHRAPVADAKASPASPTTGEAVTFDGTGSNDPDPGDTLTYAWTFDDGASATGASTQHAFTTTGAHSATLTVTDPTGRTGTANVQVTVSDPPSPPAGGDPGSGGSQGGDPASGGTSGGSDPGMQGGGALPIHRPRCKTTKRKPKRAHSHRAKAKKPKTTCRRPARKHRRKHRRTHRPAR